MSYEIVYDRQFIKLEVPNSDVPWIIPLTLHVVINGIEKL